MINKVILMGYLGADPRLSYYANNDKKRVTFSLATGSTNGKGPSATTWHDVVVFNERDVERATALTKGSRVYIEGYINKNTYQAKDGTTQKAMQIIATTLFDLGKPPTHISDVADYDDSFPFQAEDEVPPEMNPNVEPTLLTAINKAKAAHDERLKRLEGERYGQ